jgi:hypothetical protein
VAFSFIVVPQGQFFKDVHSTEKGGGEIGREGGREKKKR